MSRYGEQLDLPLECSGQATGTRYIPANGLVFQK
jgi:hypothetical protein